MAVQTSYDIEHAPGVAGAIAESQITNSRGGLVAEGDIPFGRYCVQGTAAPQSTLPTLAAEITGLPAGVSQRVQDRVADANDVLEYKDGKDMTVCDLGVIWMSVDEAVTEGTAVFIRFAGGNLGMARSDVDGVNAVALPNARFASSTAGAGLAKVRINDWR